MENMAGNSNFVLGCHFASSPHLIDNNKLTIINNTDELESRPQFV